MYHIVKSVGSGAVAGKILLVTNAAGSGIVGIFLDLATAFLRGILPGVGTKRRITKRQNYKTAKLQNGDYYKTSKSQNGDYYKTATVTKRRKKIF